VTAARNFENALARAESDAVGAATTANLVLRELKRAGHAAASGQVRDLRRALDIAAEQTQVAVLASSYAEQPDLDVDVPQD